MRDQRLKVQSFLADKFRSAVLGIRIHESTFDGKLLQEDVDQRQFEGICRIRNAEQQYLAALSGDVNSLSHGDRPADAFDDYIRVILADGCLKLFFNSRSLSQSLSV